LGFRSLVDVELHLDPVTVLIGRSGTGKSNFVKAVRRLRNWLANPGHSGIEDSDLPATLSPPFDVGYELDFETPGVNGLFSYAIRWRNWKSRQGDTRLSESLRLNGTPLFSRDGSSWTKQPDIIGIKAPDGIVLGRLTGLPESTVAHLVLSDGIGCYDFAGTIMTGETPPRNGRAAGLDDVGSRFLSAFEDIFTNVREYRRLREINSALKSISRSVKGVQLMPERSGISVNHDFKGSTFPVHLAQESEGFRRFFAHLLALYQIPSKQTLVFEEPENGIYPGALAALADEFEACPRQDRGQVILTTHSPQLLDRFRPESIRVFEMVDRQTKVGPLVSDQLESLREHLLGPGDLLTAVPAMRAPDEPQAAEAVPS
jgi:energy-coupling factor transporter ATP-binding protein EcfA2